MDALAALLPRQACLVAATDRGSGGDLLAQRLERVATAALPRNRTPCAIGYPAATVR